MCSSGALAEPPRDIARFIRPIHPSGRREGARFGRERFSAPRCRTGAGRQDGAATITDDATLVARVRSGDLDAYAELVRRHAPMAVRTAVLLGAGADAEDVVQEALVKAYRSLGRYREGAAFRPCLLQIVANETRNNHRSVVRRGARERRVTLSGDLLDPEEQVADREQKVQLLAAVASLPERLRIVVTCRYLLE